MSANLNKVFLMGNLTRDPEMQQLPTTSLCQFGMAINRQMTLASGETREEVCFVDVVAFGRNGEVVSQYVRKGQPLFVEGRLRFEQWDDRETGKKRSRLSVVAERVQLLGGPGQGQSQGQSQGQHAAPGGYAPGGYAAPAAPGYGQAPQGYAQGGYAAPSAPAYGQSAPQGYAPPPRAAGPQQGGGRMAVPPPAAPEPMPVFEPLPDKSEDVDNIPF